MGEKEMCTGLWAVYLKERGCMVDPGVDVRIRLNGWGKIEYEGVDWINLAKDKDKRWAVKFGFHNMCRVS